MSGCRRWMRREERPGGERVLVRSTGYRWSAVLFCSIAAPAVCFYAVRRLGSCVPVLTFLVLAFVRA